MDKLIKASLIASIVTIGGNMEEEPLIKLNWGKIEREFCMTKEEYENDRDVKGAYDDSVYYFKNWEFVNRFVDYMDMLIVAKGGIRGKRRGYAYNDELGRRYYDNLIAYNVQRNVRYLYKKDKDKFEAKVNEMLLNELAESKNKKDENKKDENKKDSNGENSSYDKGRGCWCF